MKTKQNIITVSGIDNNGETHNKKYKRIAKSKKLKGFTEHVNINLVARNVLSASDMKYLSIVNHRNRVVHYIGDAPKIAGYKFIKIKII